MSDFNPVVWFEIYADDLARARAFYETVLGVTLEPMPLPGGMDGFQMLAFPSTMGNPGTGGTLCKMEGVPAGAGESCRHPAHESSRACACRRSPAGRIACAGAGAAA